MKRLVLALQLMTRLPLPSIEADEVDFAGAIGWCPAAGMVVGLAVAGMACLGLRVDPWVGALSGLVAWVAVTGALHLDGLGDIADGAGAAHGYRDGDSDQDRARLLTVLADPHIGSFGVVAIVLQLLAKLVLLRFWLEVFPPWMMVPLAMTARIGPLVWTRCLPSLHEGLADRFRAGWRAGPLILWAALGLLCGIRAPGLLAWIVMIPLWGWWLRRRIGGISGDGHGAGIELLESGLLLIMLVSR
ncbi:adenosylcobinamide-GDP ribazoletransferase [Sphingobium sp. LB126]|uniref:adenosylcobinamide-GDP ribazoletransferase n=1 Tax=Sphingobium sp. LB126 TaxID=1983755 RepID=UPI000C20BFDF|nr:adenosylcobinamide-GDP ribazoletransferase [Sphingobium sp. LB126]PJG46154.1 adenosylcobinamide-GDP ribazoletransferase [Sphingobium sp. LB126]